MILYQSIGIRYDDVLFLSFNGSNTLCLGTLLTKCKEPKVSAVVIEMGYKFF